VQTRAEIVAWVGGQILPHEREVRAWLRRTGSRPEDIDDIVQEAYCRLAALPSVSHIANGRAYFFQTARNVAIERMRKALVVRMDQMTDFIEADVVDLGPSPERIVASRRELRLVARLIEELPSRCRQIFKLRRIQGVPQREVARMLGVTENVVELQVMRGLRLILRGLTDAEQQASPSSPVQGHDQTHSSRRGRRGPGR
jgi:RNA polymerase sigma-70 factor (ECF subfamily)